MHYKEPADRNQLIIFNYLDESIKSDHPIRIIDILVDSIVNNNRDKFIYRGKSNIGQKAYSPEIYLKLYIYGYLNGISSSRALERETNRNIEVKWLLGNLQPDFKSIADYRKNNREQIDFVTKQMRQFFKREGFIRGDFVAIDGTKIKANTKRGMRNLKKIENQLSHINEEMKGYLAKLVSNDKLEKDIDFLDNSEENKKLVDTIAELQKEIERLNNEKEILKKSGKKQISLSDLDASLMLTRNGKLPSYNMQCTVDSENMMIMSMYPTEFPSDMNEMKPMLEKLKEEYDETPDVIVGDKGYNNPDEIMEIEKENDIECITPVIKSTRDKDKIKFTYDKEKDEYVCSEGGRLILFSRNKKKKDKFVDVYRGQNCKNCRRRHECTKSPKGRLLMRYKNQEWRDKYKKRMLRKSNKAIINERKAIVEHVFGTMKYWMGQIPIKLRGKEKVGTEINIYSTAYNIKRLLNIESFNDIMNLIRSYNWTTA